MKDYVKPYIDEEIIEIEDVIAASTNDGENLDPFDLWGDDPDQ